MEPQFGRLGIPMSRSTTTDLFHRAAELVAPLAHRTFQLIAASEVVLADETPMPVRDAREKPYIWPFVAGNDPQRRQPGTVYLQAVRPRA